MFKSAELPWLITFFQMFYNDKPVDWLLDHLIYTKVCNWDKDMVSDKLLFLNIKFVILKPETRKIYYFFDFLLHLLHNFLEAL